MSTVVCVALSIFVLQSSVFAGARERPPTCFGGRATIVGTDGADVLVGTEGADVIVARAGRDKVIAKGGKDRICTGGGPDVVNGGGDSDRVAGGPGGDVIRGGAESDNVHGNSGADDVRGGADADFLRPSDGNDFVHGGAGFDVAEYFDARKGIRAHLGGARVTGSGVDRVFSVSQVEGTKFDDVIIGGSARESLNGYGGDDRLRGRGGLDTLWGGSGDDSLEGGSGADYAAFYLSRRPVVADLATGRARGDGADDVSSIASLFGSTHADTLIGNSGANHFIGGNPGDVTEDQIEGRGGADVLFAFGDTSFEGGAGTDTVRFLNGPAVVDLTTGVATSGGFAFSLSGVEAITGTDEDDQLVGDAAANRLSGGGGDDVLSGAEGDDALDGGAGSDRCLNGETNSRCEESPGPTS